MDKKIIGRRKFLKLRKLILEGTVLTLSTTSLGAQENLLETIARTSSTSSNEQIITYQVEYPTGKSVFTKDELKTLRTLHYSEIEDGMIRLYPFNKETNNPEFLRVKKKQIKKAGEYDKLLGRIEKDKQTFQRIYSTAADNEKSQVIEQARIYLEDVLTKEIWPMWIGTGRSYEGNSEQPLEGKIACGYFVSTTLENLSLNLNRIRLGQHPSENIMKFLIGSDYQRFSNNKALEKVNKGIEKKYGDKADGVYLMGLDIHTGFLYKHGNKLDFVHSSYLSPWSVVWEDGFESLPLVNSGYRVVGKVFTDELIKKWINNEKIQVPQWKPN